MPSLILVVLVCWLSGCATIFGAKQKDFDLRSDPDQADVYENGHKIGTTPAKLRLSNLKEHTFVFKKLGYNPASCTLEKGTDAGWVIGTILGWGLLGVVVDGATGNWSQTKGKECTGVLEPAPGAPTAAPMATAPDAARTAVNPASEVAPSPPTTQAQPAAGYTQLPEGTNYIGDPRIRVYYPVGCAAQHDIPAELQIFFQSAAGAERDGFRRSGDC